VIANSGSDLESLERGFARQGAQGRQMHVLLASMLPSIVKHIAWLSKDNGVWDAILASCGHERFGALANALGLDVMAVPPRVVFLTGLSTVSTYYMAWDLVQQFSTGAVHETLLGIRQIEDAVNALALHVFRGATYYYRGESVPETIGVYRMTVGHAWYYSYVSLSSNPATALGFTVGRLRRDGETKVVLVIDAHKAQELGIFPAVYSMAADALGLTRAEESTGRTFPVGLAHELQAHFCDRWPLGSEAAMVAVLTTAPLQPDDRIQLEETGLPVLDSEALMPRRG